MDVDQILLNAVRDGVREGIKDKLIGYNSPINEVVKDAVTAYSSEFRVLLVDALKACLKDKDFRADITASVRKTIARELIGKFGGEVQKQVNALKADPATRARITLAVEEIVQSQMAGAAQ